MGGEGEVFRMSYTIYAKEVQLKSTGVKYWGAKDTEGTWKEVRSGNDLVFYRYESGTWVEKARIAA